MRNLLNRIRCLFGQHDNAFHIAWAPSIICLRVICESCGKEQAHIDLPKDPTRPQTPVRDAQEKLH